MHKIPKARRQVFQNIWDRYKDTLWRIEQSWNSADLDYEKRITLTESVMEMINIEKRIKSIETQTLRGDRG